jgi:hypothetical protein
VLIDELGRGTSPREGVGISHAIAESLIGVKVSIDTDTAWHVNKEGFYVLRNVSMLLYDFS